MVADFFLLPKKTSGLVPETSGLVPDLIFLNLHDIPKFARPYKV